MFTKTSRFYDALYHFKDYAAASINLHNLIKKINPNSKRLLDVACGTGKHLEILREYYNVEGLDVNPELLEIARQRCPGVPLHEGNMVDLDLKSTFDVVTACLAP